MEILRKIKYDTPAISHQLKTLKDNDIVRCVRKGKEVIHYLSDEHVSKLAQVFDHTSINQWA